MKIRHIIITIVTAALLVLALQSCSLFGTSIDARLDMFEDDLNSADRSGAYTNFHPDTEGYATADVLDGFWPYALGSYAIYGRDISGDTVNATIEGSGGYVAKPIRFNMAKDGLFDWKIMSIELPPGTPYLP
jgi:hypothetical protein